MKKTKKIIAIGGGENGRLLEDGKYAEYNTKKIDKRIVDLTGKKNPNYLFLAHAMYPNKIIEESYFNTMIKIYGEKLGCNCDVLYGEDLINTKIVEKKMKWADIVYEGGGDTKKMIDLWKRTGFDKKLHDAWVYGKVICGVSAGAVCWFKYSNSDTLNETFSIDSCLGWINLYVTPHCNEKGRSESSKKHLKTKNIVGLLLSNSSAIEIIDDKFKIITESKESFVMKSYWKDNEYIKYNIKLETEYQNLVDLTSLM